MIRIALVLMRVLGWLPLAWLRALGWLLGRLLYPLVRKRREVVLANLRLCFPDWDEARRRTVAMEVFVRFTQAWLDRGWLWHGSRALLERRLRMTGAVELMRPEARPLMFVPHFFGLDAAWTAFTLHMQQRCMTIYSEQVDAQVDAWIRAGRLRFGSPRLFGRHDGLRPIVSAMREGGVLCLAPDMNITRQEAVFVPFFGVPTATITSLSRFARMGRAQVVPVIARLTRAGYEIEILPAWTDFPTEDPETDAATMNRHLERYVASLPGQYYWVHKRFKVRPPGEPPIY